MYIHSYQIHNVLNVYRKQLSQGPGTNTPQPSASASAKERITISANGQKQSIFNKISAEIADRITQFSPENQFEKVLADKLSGNTTHRADKDTPKESKFTYTFIDEQNRKTTNTLPIEKLSPFINKTETNDLSIGNKGPGGTGHLPEMEQADDNHNEKDI